MPRSRYYRAPSSSSSNLTTSSSSTSLYTIPENMSTDHLHRTGSYATRPTPSLTRRPSWTTGDDAVWTVNNTRQPTGSIAPGALPTQWPTVSRQSRRSSRASRRRSAGPSAQTFADILGGLFQSPFTANNPEGAQQTSSRMDGPYPALARKNKRRTWG
ncbi:hypothetical protein PRZ48_003920 [Zasmidium cellare]|uniref:Uncharacterized protein n=1 Tax=Zasmidium cellare TaxID=395010 RepID=A0ABR0EX04_ZASCE|nr:hypothetical protein PRZ48_003920 [Zasmidium cellare]